MEYLIIDEEKGKGSIQPLEHREYPFIALICIKFTLP